MCVGFKQGEDTSGCIEYTSRQHVRQVCTTLVIQVSTLYKSTQNKLVTDVPLGICDCMCGACCNIGRNSDTPPRGVATTERRVAGELMSRAACCDWTAVICSGCIVRMNVDTYKP